MSTSAITSQLNAPEYFSTRRTDLNQLGQALSSGNLGAAQTAFNNIVSLGQSGPFPNGAPFAIAQREQDFTAIGQALQSGDLAGAQQAFDSLKSTFGPQATPSSGASSGANSGSGSGPEIVVNLGNSGGPEQIDINISGASNGGEQISLSVNGQGPNAQQVTFNLNPADTNEQLVINLLGASGSGSAGTTSASGSLSVSA
ncbi:MAG TPA: hypothetical protein VND65_16075 [Candidatus Binatia bacterium]|nr:hypothetical protein [Candidatus Binatia bacterium]